VSPSLRYRTPLYNLSSPRRRPLEAILDADDGMVEQPEYSMSKTLTSASPAQVTSVRSSEWGMNFTEKIFAVWPVETVVVRANGEVDESGW